MRGVEIPQNTTIMTIYIYIYTQTKNKLLSNLSWTSSLESKLQLNICLYQIKWATVFENEVSPKCCVKKYLCNNV